MQNNYTESDLGSVRNLTAMESGGWCWDVVKEDEDAFNWEESEYAYKLVEYHTNTEGEGLWVRGQDWDGSVKYTQVAGTCDFATKRGSQTKSAVHARLTRYFGEDS